MVKTWRRVLNRLNPVHIPPVREADIAYEFVEPQIRAPWADGARAHLRGFVGEAVKHWSQAMELQLILAKRYGVAQDFRYFGPVWVGVIGHIGHLTALLQARRLGMYKAKRIIIGSHMGCANRAYLDYLSEECDIIRDESELEHIDLRFKTELPAVVKIDKKWMFITDAVRVVQERWVSEGHGALFNLKDDHKRRAEAVLEEWGIPKGSWFVTLHVREGGRISGGWTVDSIRNCSVSDYIEAVKFVTGMGGWVIRIGGADYEPLPKMKNVVDYATDKIHKDWLDVYLLAAARFVIATNSGPPWVSVSFGVPVLFTNWAPRGINLFWQDCTVLYKTLIDRRSGEDLPLELQHSEPLSQIESIKKLHDLGYDVRSNTSEELRVATEVFIRKLGKLM